MEIYIWQQLADLGAAVLSGVICGMIYDLLRPVRLRNRYSKVLTHTVDALFVLIVLLGMFLFALRIGKGELRLFVLCGFMGGIAVYYLLLSKLLRPLWDFWADAVAEFLSLLWKPFAIIGGVAKKVGLFIKKYFHFLRKYATIKKYKWEFSRLHSSISDKGGRSSHEKKRKSKDKT